MTGVAPREPETDPIQDAELLLHHAGRLAAALESLRAAALAGNGIADLPTFMVGPDIAAGRLQPVLTATPPTELGIFALYAPNRYMAAKTRVCAAAPCTSAATTLACAK